ncbi:MAG: response regulator, partial [Microcystis aeruginosa Ma_AC_P_19900807_S299]
MSEILLVEDSQTQRELICDLLRNSGIKVTIATDGVEALEYIQRGNPDLVVL